MPGCAANEKLTNVFATEVTSPRRRSNHWATIVRDDRVSNPCPVKRSSPNPTLITAMPTARFIGPTKLNPTSTPASPNVATSATTRGAVPVDGATTAGKQEAARPRPDQVGDRELESGQPGAGGEFVGEDADACGLSGHRGDHADRAGDHDHPAVVDPDSDRIERPPIRDVTAARGETIRRAVNGSDSQRWSPDEPRDDSPSGRIHASAMTIGRARQESLAAVAEASYCSSHGTQHHTAPLIVLGAAGFALRSRPAGTPPRRGIEQLIESQGGGDVDLDLDGDGGFSVQTEEGGMSIDEDGNFVITDADGSVVTGNVDADGDGVTVESEDGSFSSGAGTELPEDWPADVPTPDGLAILSSHRSSDGDTDRIHRHRRDRRRLPRRATRSALESAGFELESEFNADTARHNGATPTAPGASGSLSSTTATTSRRRSPCSPTSDRAC